MCHMLLNTYTIYTRSLSVRAQYSRLCPHTKSSLYSPGTDRTENASPIIACSLVAGETTFPQSCSQATVVVRSSIYTALTWQWVYTSQYEKIIQDFAYNMEVEDQIGDLEQGGRIILNYMFKKERRRCGLNSAG
jgi:hypothetical protein